jgi:hypothetical protein
MATHVFNSFQRALACANTAKHELMYTVPDQFLYDVLAHVRNVCGTRVVVVGGVKEDTNNYGTADLNLDTAEWVERGSTFEFIDSIMRSVRLVNGDVLHVTGHGASLLDVETQTEIDVDPDDVLPLAETFALSTIDKGRAAVRFSWPGDAVMVYTAATRMWAKVARSRLNQIGISSSAVEYRDGVVVFNVGEITWSCRIWRREEPSDLRYFANMREGTEHHAAVALQDNGALVSGGIDIRGFVTPRCEIYHDGLKRWVPAAALPDGRSNHAMVFLSATNQVLLAGGNLSGGVTNTTLLYDLETDEWSEGPPMPSARADFGMSVYSLGIHDSPIAPSLRAF